VAGAVGSFGAVALRWPDEEHDTIEAADTAELRRWFDTNHEDVDGVWIMYWKKGSGRSSVTWSEAVDVLLCFGWIDTKIQSIDDDRYVQYVTHRRAGSTWSQVNKKKLIELEAAGQMTDAGHAVVERAKTDGSWTLLDAAEAGVVPDDLDAALGRHVGARDAFEELSPSAVSSVLRKIYLSKRAATRARWVEESARRLAAGDRPPF